MRLLSCYMWSFPRFLFITFCIQATEDYKLLNQSQSSGSTSRKRSMQFSKPTIVELEGNLYLVAEDIFILGHPAVKLNKEEVDDLPVIVCWTGPHLNFETDEKTFYSLLSELFGDFNLMQNRNFVSFPIGNDELITFKN